MPKIGDDWKLVLKKAWSVRILGVTAFFSAVEVVLPIVGGNLPISPWMLALLIFGGTLAALVSRFVAQEELGVS